MIDPTELELLRETIEQLEQQRDTCLGQIDRLESKLIALQNHIEALTSVLTDIGQIVLDLRASASCNEPAI